ncbi:MAG: phosphoribosylformylglycinamidine synthase [Ignavibacteria bacterium CG_4_8_14_3_um_filter_37_9]|nr:phosphoribosylformylglycinamidine synthase subunit PurS [Ignavibacteria bacterium]OIO13899.1 MAG: phosphoribosylformylglycinamidine synthase, purS protein [Ignavibacteria bacterium CG1_02_37_35]PIP79753.1 MAG: phosphoribosylformylglycinamidine synthase [Ignavibacteria bacterium CG22_combo_CG10-13_8_21_14_all_37_15]PIS45269.1 MAG: phosphoribosylformylglycinamidine synthase [Ignavibacteria bacterium CG08_land_8_20_14_0_20_37_9]PIX00133.1 MAG: phosphoribosylformylglycinamidine synthase [Ignavib
MYKAKVIIKRKKSILDPQGKAAEHGAVLLGFKNIADVRIDKQVEFLVNVNDEETAKKEVSEFCSKLLSNPTMEDFEINLEEIDEV